MLSFRCGKETPPQLNSGRTPQLTCSFLVFVRSLVGNVRHAGNDLERKVTEIAASQGWSMKDDGCMNSSECSWCRIALSEKHQKLNKTKYVPVIRFGADDGRCE